MKFAKNKLLAVLLATTLTLAAFSACSTHRVVPDVSSSEATSSSSQSPETPVTSEPASSSAVSESNVSSSQSSEVQIGATGIEEADIYLGSGMEITEIGGYTGIYMEDGSDELVSGVLMMIVTNTSEDTIQYAEISMPVGDKNAQFKLTTLPAGATVVLLEQSRMAYQNDFEYANATLDAVALFNEPMSLKEDQLKLQVLNGAINVTNISDKDISGDIYIYYKNSAVDVYYGGITYRTRIESGLAAGEIKQVMGTHFSESGSAILFVTIGE